MTSMKKNELKSYRDKNLEELVKVASKKKVELTKFKTDIIASREKNVKKVKNYRHELSQILSLIKEKSLMQGGSEK